MEVDSVAGDMIVILSSPFIVSAYEETVLSNDPEIKNGTTSGNIMFSPVAIATQQFTFPVKGALIGQSGVEKVRIWGAPGEKRILDPSAGEDGELVIRWKFTAG